MSFTLTRRGLISMSAVAAGGAALGLSGCTGDTRDAPDGNGGSGATGQTVVVWFMEGSVPQPAIDHLQSTFGAENEGNTLQVEVQPRDDIIAKLQSSLESTSKSPDLVETVNTQSSIFSSVGSFTGLDDIYEELGGEDLIQSFVAAGTWDDTLYAVPLFADPRGVFYRKDLFAAANIAEPTTMDGFTEAAINVGNANPDGVAGFTGTYLSAGDEHGVESLMFAGGGDWATQDGDGWVETLTDPATVESLKRVQRLFTEGTAQTLDTQAFPDAVEYFNEGKVGVLLATGRMGAGISQEMWDADKVAVMPLPGAAEGDVGRTFADGSNISLASNAQNPELARQALRVIFGEEFQRLLGGDGRVPGNTRYGDATTGALGEVAVPIVTNSHMTPTTPQWDVAAGDNLFSNFFTAIAQGKDVATSAADYGAQLEDILNR